MTNLVIIVHGMNTHLTISAIIELWPDSQTLASDVGVKPIVAYRWHQRSSIPAEYDKRVLDAAKRRKIKLTPWDLVNARHSQFQPQSGAA